MASDDMGFYYLGAGVWFLTALAIGVGFVVLAFVVKKTRPDAFVPLIAAALVRLGATFVGSVLSRAFLMMAERSGGLSGIQAVSFATTTLDALLGLLSAGLLGLGILRLAQPREQPAASPFARGRYE